MTASTFRLVLLLSLPLVAACGPGIIPSGNGEGGGPAHGVGGSSGQGGAPSFGGTPGFGGTPLVGSGGTKATGGSPAAGSGGKGGAVSSGSGGAAGGSKGSGGAGQGGARTAGTGGTAGTAAGGKPGATGGASAAGGASAGGSSAGGSPSTGTGGAGNPNGSCSTGVPARGQPVDTSTPTTVVGTGTAASCTFAQLQTAVTQGGIITFDCGPAPTTILVSATLNAPITKNTVIDGGNKITLDGGNANQILTFNSPDFRATDRGLTVQHIAFVNGKKTPTQAIPDAPAPCSQGWDDGEGGAIYVRDGGLTVIDAIFTNNHAAPLGPDTGGGAIYVLGSKPGVMIVGSTFSGNSAANAGAVGGLFAELNIYNSLFTSNMATGHDANSDDAKMCSVMNNGQNEIGSGGNGGAIYSDGNSVNVTLCGDAILNNAAGTKAFGGGLFFTSNDMGGVLSIADSTIKGNTGGHWTNVTTGSVTDAGTAVGVNAKSITIKNSMIQ